MDRGHLPKLEFVNPKPQEPSRPDRNILPRDEQGWVADSKRKKNSKIEPLGIRGHRQNIVVTCKQSKLCILKTPGYPGEITSGAVYTSKFKPTADQCNNEGHAYQHTQSEKNDEKRVSKIH